MGSFEEMEVKMRVLQQRSTEVQAAIHSARELKNEGKTLGLKIPENIRSRLDIQAESWGLENHKRTVITAMLVGLDQMEKLHKLKGREPAHGRQGSVSNVSGLLGPNDQGDSAAHRHMANQSRS
jgi:hypothetical protein